MNIAIVHYHLNRGGVTQVIRNQLRTLAGASSTVQISKVAVLFGGRKRDWPDRCLPNDAAFPLELIAIPELEYDRSSTPNVPRLKFELQRVLDRIGFDQGASILHIHNHALGKNASLPGAVAQLARDGYRILLQIHDFAEDFRLDNYRHLTTALRSTRCGSIFEELYPQSTSIHYAVLNGRDFQMLKRAGVPPERLHLLPNPVFAFDGIPTRDAVRPSLSAALDIPTDAHLVVYPVRGIRRKNLGEMLLLAALDPRNSVYSLTLAPLNPLESEFYNAWQALATDLQLPCRFDIDNRTAIGYSGILAAADTLLTTSVAEGFGMVFLESWLAGRYLTGRDLPEITADYVSAGMELNGLYSRLDVPVELVGEAAFRDQLAEAYQTARLAYGYAPAARHEVDLQIDKLVSDGSVDFAYLNSRLQQRVIELVTGDNALLESTRMLNPNLEAVFGISETGTAEKIVHNAQVVRRKYSQDAAGERLGSIYRAVSQSPMSFETWSLPHGSAILEDLLDVRRLHPIRLETWNQPPKSFDA